MNAKKAWKRYLNDINDHFFQLQEVDQIIKTHGYNGSYILDIELNNHPCKISINLNKKCWESALINCIEQVIVTNRSFHWNPFRRKVKYRIQ